MALTKKPRADGQLSALAGEFFVAAELLKREFQTSITFGNAKAIDLLAHNSTINHIFKVQVKTLRTMNYFLISPKAIKSDVIYVFVLLNKPDAAVRYFVVPGKVLANEAERFGKDFQHPSMPGIHPKRLMEFENAWGHFDRIPETGKYLASS
jgi:hypothetical protein